MKYLLILSLYIFSSITIAQENTFLVNSPTDKTYDKYTNFIFDNPGTDEAFIALIRIIEPDILSNNIEGEVDKLDLFKMDFPDKEKDIDKIIMLL